MTARRVLTDEERAAARALALAAPPATPAHVDTVARILGPAVRRAAAPAVTTGRAAAARPIAA